MNANESDKLVTILLVDRSEKDFATINDILKRLKSLKYTLDWADSFDEGIKLIKSDKYDVCLLDHNTDDQGGLTFLNKVKQLPTKCAVILLSDGLSIDGDMAALRAGATDYLQKARLLPGILHRAIRFALHRQSNKDSTNKLRSKINKLLRTQAVSEIACGIANDLVELLVKIDRQFQHIHEHSKKSAEEIPTFISDGRKLCKQAYQLAENIIVCTNPETALKYQHQPSKSRKRILVIDSNYNILEVAKLYLEAGNLDNKCFSNPVYALEWYRQNHKQIDGVILDCTCPPLSASQCISELRAVDPAVKIVLCSNYQKPEYQKLIEQGAARFFEKPAGYPSMVSWLVEVLA